MTGDLIKLRLDVLAAVEAAGGAFTFADIARAVGAPKAGGAASQRLRRALVRLVDAGAVQRAGRGRYVVGEVALAADAMGPGAALRARTLAALRDLGGYATRAKLAQELGIDDDAGVTGLARVLGDDDDFITGTPIDGFRTVWRLRDDLLEEAIITGRWLRLDVRLKAIRALGLRHAWAGAGPDLDRLFADIGAGVQGAREAAGLDVADLLDGEVGVAFRRGLDAARGELARWWAAARREHGAGCLTLAWAALECPDAVEPAVVESTTVLFWRRLAVQVGADAASLSRGASEVRSP